MLSIDPAPHRDAERRERERERTVPILLLLRLLFSKPPSACFPFAYLSPSFAPRTSFFCLVDDWRMNHYHKMAKEISDCLLLFRGFIRLHNGVVR